MTNTPQASRVLIVDDDPLVAEALAHFVRELGHDATECTSAEEALASLDRAQAKGNIYDILVSDVSMPGMNGLELLRECHERHPGTVVIMLTGFGTIETAVEAIRSGAFDYIAKPVVDDEFAMTLERAGQQREVLRENTDLKERLSARSALRNLVAADPRIVKAFDMVKAVAPSKATVLMTGESGTGKSMIAKAIHELSPRDGKPFVEIHCGSIPETLLESELFGHVRGAFTGADHDKEGRFEAADTGTIFIDEINSATPAMQLKLLRVLQERKFEPVGSTKTVEVDVRVVLAANEPLEQLVREGRFREDLFYRINVVRVELPPLRDRPADVPALVEHFVLHFNTEHGKSIVGIEADALLALKQYAMPGNVRELSNIIERAVVLAPGETITLADLPPHVAAGESSPAWASRSLLEADAGPWQPTPLAEALLEPEKKIILTALQANDWNRQKTADDLDINRTTLYKKMKTLGIDKVAG